MQKQPCCHKLQGMQHSYPRLRQMQEAATIVTMRSPCSSPGLSGAL